MRKVTGKVKQKKTIRKLTPMARKLAHLTRDTKSIVTRLAHLTEELQRLEMDERAAQAQIRGHASVCPLISEPAPGHEWPELPNGEGTAVPTASEIEQGVEP
jgi:DNA repair exonuclease SbcCD ATPase subunit